MITISNSEILRRAKCPPDSTVVVSGTLLEGIGNAHSDIDVYVFAEARPDPAAFTSHNFSIMAADGVHQIYDYIDDRGLGFDVEYYSYQDAQAVADELDRLYQRARLSTKIFRPTLSLAAEDLIHKVSIGKVISGDLSRLPLDFQALKYQFCFLKYRNLTGGYPEFKDLRGAVGIGDLDTALSIARDYVTNHANALSFLAGNSNPKKKWVSRKLKALPDALRGLGIDIIDWLHADASTERRRLDLILAGLQLIERIFVETRALLDSRPQYYSLSDALRLTEEEYNREQIKDVQTNEEFDCRRRQFTPTVPPLDHYIMTEIGRSITSIDIRIGVD